MTVRQGSHSSLFFGPKPTFSSSLSCFLSSVSTVVVSSLLFILILVCFLISSIPYFVSSCGVAIVPVWPGEISGGFQ